MKRKLTILLTLIALSCGYTAQAEPNGSQRIELNAAGNASVEGMSGHIRLTAGSANVTFSIYTITGQLLRTVRVERESSVTVEVPKGFYVVRLERAWSRKVIVK